MILLEQISLQIERGHSALKLNHPDTTQQRYVAEIIDTSNQIEKLCRYALQLPPHQQEPVWQAVLSMAEQIQSRAEEYQTLPGMIAEYIWMQVKSNANLGDVFRYRLAFWNNIIN